LDQGISTTVKVITMLPCNGKTSIVRGERMEAVTFYLMKVGGEDRAR
jgi:hypothetical protein